jgi:hypothetical protein
MLEKHYPQTSNPFSALHRSARKRAFRRQEPIFSKSFSSSNLWPLESRERAVEETDRGVDLRDPLVCSLPGNFASAV